MNGYKCNTRVQALIAISIAYVIILPFLLSLLCSRDKIRRTDRQGGDQ